MNRRDWSPTVVVGVDFGMTCTGVAYTSADSGWAKPEAIQKWPGRKPGLYSKHPSRVGRDRSGRAVDWGTCMDLSGEVSVQDKEFKLLLDPLFLDTADGGLSHSRAVQNYIYYMGKLFRHINDTLVTKIPRWHDRNVEYRLSIPTTWKNPQLTAQLKRWLGEAGWTNTASRRVIFSATEAEAAAVYAAKDDQLRENDVLMVVDAGGATTDINVLRVAQKRSDVTRVMSLDKVEGINIGATMIDAQARRIIEQKLKDLHVYDARGPSYLAELMMESSDFEYYKCNFGGDYRFMDFKMVIPKERPGERDKWVTLKYTEMESVFDHLAAEIILSIKEQINNLARSSPYPELRYIILSGGLGSSNYIKQKVSTEIYNANSRYANTRPIEILVAPDPQLAVAKGLVMDRSQTLEHDITVWAGRCCRVSYGILINLPYDGREHVGEPTFRDPISGELWVKDQIEWIIKEGDVIREDGIIKECSLRVTEDQQLEPFNAHIVMSEAPAADLPPSKYRGPVTEVCVVEGLFSPSDFINSFVKVKRIPFRKRKGHDIARFNLKVIVGSTDLEFEFESLDGRSYSQSTAKVNVIWGDVQIPVLPT